MIIYDIEIKKAIAGRNDQRQAGVEYCEGWNDHAGMGVSCIGAYDYAQDRYRMFLADNMPEFTELCASADVIGGFNSIPFDNKVCQLNDIPVPDDKSYDLLREIWAAAGLPPAFNFRTHGGYGLDAMAFTNLGASKSGNGATAPVDFQRGRFGTLTDYCLTDVWLTKKLMDLVIRDGQLKCPKTGSMLTIRKPF